MSTAYVYEALRTPRGRVRRDGGTLAGVPAHDLLAGLLRELADRGVRADSVDDVVIGVSTTHGEQAGDVARVALMAAGWPDSIPAGTVSRFCCSGLDALASAAAQVASGQVDVVLAGGVESMSRVPMLGDRPAFAVDAELGAATGFVTIGVSADYTAAVHGFSREELDAWAMRSHQRSAAATWDSVVPVGGAAGVVLAGDEGARADVTMEALAAMPAIFGDDPLWERIEARFPGFTRPGAGLHTVATAPQLCDGASASVVGSAAAGQAMGLAPRGRIAGWAHTAVRSPGLDATIEAARLALQRAGIAVADVTVAEFNESFSVTPLLLTRELGMDSERVNIQGGAVSVGHPLGASGGILLANALDLLRRQGGGYALLVIPAALGLASAVVVEGLE
ncbi:MAG TPA: thiolase family protein [Phycicoccus sp.]|jgi:acetyl-CoA C-acetyltransferase|nr:thiolase family protein [Phycicoccus sp.]HQK31838.1 thiolase family protein [Phycicoccus sp.]HQY98099.1 thiolase family protein [Phycicoccus sp.]HRA45256.1 thiolase family protein [Phycicoccus sp.]